MAKNNHTKNESQLLELIENSTDNNFLEEALKIILEKVMELEIEEKIKSSKSERTEDCLGYRSGTRRRSFDTQLGTFYLEVPKIRNGGYIPSFIEPYQRLEKALLSTVCRDLSFRSFDKKNSSSPRKSGNRKDIGSRSQRT